MQPKTQNSFTFYSLYHRPSILHNMFFSIFVAIAIAVFCVQLVKQLFLYICKEVLGAFRAMAYFLNIICDFVLLFRKYSMWAAISLFAYQNYLAFAYKQTRSPRSFFNPIFNVFFMLLFVNFYVFPTSRRSSL